MVIGGWGMEGNSSHACWRPFLLVFGEALYHFLNFVMDRMVLVMGHWFCSITVMMYIYSL